MKRSTIKKSFLLARWAMLVIGLLLIAKGTSTLCYRPETGEELLRMQREAWAIKAYDVESIHPIYYLDSGVMTFQKPISFNYANFRIVTTHDIVMDGGKLFFNSRFNRFDYYWDGKQVKPVFRPKYVVEPATYFLAGIVTLLVLLYMFRKFELSILKSKRRQRTSRIISSEEAFERILKENEELANLAYLDRGTIMQARNGNIIPFAKK